MYYLKHDSKLIVLHYEYFKHVFLQHIILNHNFHIIL